MPSRKGDPDAPAVVTSRRCSKAEDKIEEMRKAWQRIRTAYRREIEDNIRRDNNTDDDIRKMYRDLCPPDLWPDGVDDGREWTCRGKEKNDLVRDMLAALWHVTGIEDPRHKSQSKGID